MKQSRLLANACMALFAIAASAGALRSASAQEAVVVTIPVPLATIQAGDTITDGQLIDRRVRISRQLLSSITTDRAALAGRIARRLLPAGHSIPLSATRTPHVISQGDPVTMVYRDGALSIEARGISLATAGLGEPISVRSADGGAVVRGRVAAPSLVTVD